MPKPLSVVDSQRGGVSDPSDDLGSSYGQVEIISIHPDLVGWEIHPSGFDREGHTRAFLGMARLVITCQRPAHSHLSEE